MDSHQIVLERLSEMKDGVLDIDNLGLTSLPDSPLWEQVKILDCDYNQLTTLPTLPQVKELFCRYNQLTSLPALPKVEILYCRNNQLMTLPVFPEIIKIYCGYNQLTSLPDLPKVEILQCYNNQLTTLPALPKIKILGCDYNPLLYPKDKNKLIHSCRKNLLQLRVRSLIAHWRHFTITSIINKKRELHTELLYSPDVKGNFYLTQRLSTLW